GDQNVAGFEVAVNDKILVRIMNCRADHAKKLEPLDCRTPAGITIFVNRLAFDVLHNEVRQSVVGGSAVEQPGDVWMFQVGKYLTLVSEAGDDEIGIKPALDQLDGHLLVIMIVVPNRAIDCAHSAAADLFHNLVRTDWTFGQLSCDYL